MFNFLHLSNIHIPDKKGDVRASNSIRLFLVMILVVSLPLLAVTVKVFAESTWLEGWDKRVELSISTPSKLATFLQCSDEEQENQTSPTKQDQHQDVKMLFKGSPKERPKPNIKYHMSNPCAQSQS